MDFKVFTVDEIYKIEKTSQDVKENEDLEAYNFIDGFHCFKLLRDHYVKDKGVERVDNEIIDSADFLMNNDGKRIISIGLIFINTKNGNVYVYGCSTEMWKELFNKYFPATNLNTKADLNKLSKIKKIEIKTIPSPQLDFFEKYPTPYECDMLNELEMTDQPIEKRCVKYVFKQEGAFFNKKVLAKKLEENKGNLSIEGVDDKSNVIKLKDAFQLFLKIELECKNFDELNKITFEKIIEFLKEKERNGII